MRLSPKITLIAVAAAATLLLSGCGGAPVEEKTPKPVTTQAPKPVPTTEAPKPTVKAPTISDEDFAIEAYTIWYPEQTREAVVDFVTSTGAGPSIAAMGKQLCSMIVTNPASTITPQLDDGTVLSEDQLAAFRDLTIANYCPDLG